jgi:hypothetical protein
MDDSYKRSLEEKIKDDKDFLGAFGEIRTHRPSQAYRDGWERIFGKSTPQQAEPNS